jgi:hypothetical protein
MLTLVVSTAVADCPSFPYPNCTVIVLVVSCGTNLASFGVAAIESTVEDRPVAAGCIEPLKGRRLASAGWGYSLAALHRNPCPPSYQSSLRCCWHPKRQMMVFPFPSACLDDIRLGMTYCLCHALERVLDLILGPLEHEAKAGEIDLVARSDRLQVI